MNTDATNDDLISDQGTDDYLVGADKEAGEEVSDTASPTPDEQDVQSEETFDRAYVEDLRKESAGYRTQLRTVQEQLHRLQVEQTGKLADPADLAFDPVHLDDPDALTAAIDALLEAKPHLKRRALPVGAAAQGPKNSVTGDVNLVDLMRVGF